MRSKTFSQKSLIFYGELNHDDIAIIFQCRGLSNKLGFAYQLIFIRLFNFLPQIVPFDVVEELLIYAAVQLSIESSLISAYQRNRRKISDHQQSIISYLQLVQFNATRRGAVEEFVFQESLRLNSMSLLKIKAIQFLRSNKVLSPSEEVFNRLIATQRKLARQHIFDTVHSNLSEEMICKLSALLTTSATEKYSKLDKLKESVLRASVSSILDLISRLELIKSSGILSVNISNISSNYQKILSKEIRVYSVNRIQSLDATRRNTSLVCFLHQAYRDTMDYLIETYLKLLNKVNKSARNAEERERHKHDKAVSKALQNYEAMKQVIRDESIESSNLRKVLYERFGNILKNSDDGLNFVRGDKQDNIFKLIVNKFSYLRQFIPACLNVLELQLEHGIDSDIIAAIECLKTMDLANKRDLPEDAPSGFIPKRLRKLVIVDNKIDRKAWECALILQIRDGIKNSNIVVSHSKHFGKFSNLFMPDEEWHKVRSKFFEKAKLPEDPVLVYDYFNERINAAYDIYLLSEKCNKYAKVVNDKFLLSKDAAEKLSSSQEDGLKKLKQFISSHMRQIKLPDLLVETDNDLNFTEAFMPLNKQGLRGAGDICDIIVTIMAHGCNIGAYTMSRLVEDVPYERIKNITDWQLSDERLRVALSYVVNAISKLDVSKNWGEGKTSSSDVHLVSFSEKVLQQTLNRRFGDYALEFCTFVADNYAPYHSTVVENVGNEAAHALDGIYYNESDLRIEEHYTDTKASAGIIFTAFAFAGIEYNPRIRGIQNHRIFKIDKEKEYGSLSGLLKHKEANIKMSTIVKQWDRIGHFHASIAYGYSTASISLKKLLSLSYKNEFFQANLQIGRILKTENTLKNMVDPVMRKRRLRGLLKGEEMHQLARDINYGNRGKITARDLNAQMNCCNCLTFIMSCIVYWQSESLSKIV